MNSAENLAQHVLKLPSAGVSACELLSDGTQALPFHIVAAGASCCSSYSPAVNLRCKESPGDTAVRNHKCALAPSADTQENLQSKSKSCGFLCSPKGSGLCVKLMERVPPLLSEQALVLQVLPLSVICWSSARHK